MIIEWCFTKYCKFSLNRVILSRKFDLMTPTYGWYGEHIIIIKIVMMILMIIIDIYIIPGTLYIPIFWTILLIFIASL